MGGQAVLISRSVLTAFLDRLLLGLGALDGAAGGQALIAEHAQLLDFGLLAGATELEHLDVARTGHAVFVKGLFLFGDRAPQHQQLADVLDGCGVQLVAQLLVDLLAGRSVVAENADLDQAMGIECGVHFPLNGSGQTIATDEDDGVQVVGFGAVFPALRGS